MEKTLKLDAPTVTAAFDRLLNHKETWNLIGAPTFINPSVVEYLFDGYMPCLLVQDGDEIIDVQDFSAEMMAEGEDYATGRTRYPNLDAWAEAFIVSMTTPPAY